MSPLTVLASRLRALKPFARTFPLTLLAVSTPSSPEPARSTSPEMDLADSSRGVPDVVTLPLMLSARTEPWTSVTLTSPEIDLSSTDVDVGTVTVYETEIRTLRDRYLVCTSICAA